MAKSKQTVSGDKKTPRAKGVSAQARRKSEARDMPKEQAGTASSKTSLPRYDRGKTSLLAGESKHKKTFVGHVVSDKMTNTVVVALTRKVAHPVYKKLIRKTKKLKADTNNMEVKVGDTVQIEETRKISKDKYFKIIKKFEERGKGKA